MSNCTLIEQSQPENNEIDPLTDFLRSGARQLIAQRRSVTTLVVLEEHL